MLIYSALACIAGVHVTRDKSRTKGEGVGGRGKNPLPRRPTFVGTPAMQADSAWKFEFPVDDFIIYYVFFLNQIWN